MNLAELLSQSDAFGCLDAATCERVAATLTLREFLPGAILAVQGEPGDALFLVVSGQAAVEKTSPSGGGIRIGTFGPGAVLGELGLVTGYLRAASITACEPTTAALFEASDFNRLCAEIPQQMEPFIHWMTGRLQRTQIQSAIEETPLLRKLAPATRERFIDSLAWMELRTGELIFNEGEQGDALYLVVSGRIRLSKTGALTAPPFKNCWQQVRRSGLPFLRRSSPAACA